MGWKWNDIAEPVAEMMTRKKWELADILEGLAKDADQKASHGPEKDAFQRGRAAAFREVRDGVMPKGPRKP